MFHRDAELVEAFLTWATSAYPRWAAEVDAGHNPITKALHLETLIYDEEDEAESIAPFFTQLPPALRDRALARLNEDGRGVGGDGD